ncbi:MAG: cobalamin-binding protein [Gemmatimonadetes bacterium]|nr:cobalamin-binding protein [Gemmatimonadota bacterium]
MRVVSLACSNTEIVDALGCGDLLVGVDDHSDFPEPLVSRLPRLGPDLDPDLDRIAALRPDLVLATLTVPGHERVVEALQARGLPFVAPEPVTLEDVYRDIEDIALLLDVPERGRQLVAAMRAELDAPPSPETLHPALLVEWWPKPVIAPGRMSWATDVIRAAGARNPIGDDEVKSRPLTDDEVRELAPDAFVLSWCGVHPDKYRPDVVYRNPLWAELRAVREGRVFCVPEAYLGRPGPRLVEGVKALRNVVATLGHDWVKARL